MQRSGSIFVQLLFFYTAGLVFAYTWPSLDLKNAAAVTFLFLFGVLLILNLTYRFFRIYRLKKCRTMLLFSFYLLTACIGFWRCLHQKQDLQTNHFSKLKPEKLKIRIDDEPQVKPGSVRFKASVVQAYVQGKAIPCTGRLFVYLKTDRLKPAYGDEYIMLAKFKTVPPPANAYNFDFKAWLEVQNICHQSYLKETQLLLLQQHQGNPVLAFALALRKRQIEVYRRILKNEEAFAVASTLILGYRADLSNETLDAYAKTGTIHALSVSGMHVGIIYIVLNWLLSFCNRKRFLKLFKIVLIIAIIWFYSLLTGFSPSVLRSAIMLTVYILSKASARNPSSYNILAFSAFCILLNDPFLFFDVGFQLSYLSVFGLIYLQPLFYRWFSFKYSWCNTLWGTVSMSLAAQTVTSPLSIYDFHQFPVYFLFSNLFIMLPAALMMYIGLGILVFRLYFLAPVLEWTILFTNAGLKWISGLPAALISGIWMSKAELFLLSTALTLLILAFQHYHKKLVYASLLLFLLLEGLFTRDKFIAHRQKETVVFKLSKNSAAIYIRSSKAIVLTDVRPDSKTFKFSIKPYLDAHRITEIKCVYLPVNGIQRHN